jgi:hypothetical protein
LISFVLYWLFVFPVGIFKKILGLRNFDRGIDETAKTYWLPRGKAKTATERYRHQL